MCEANSCPIGTQCRLFRLPLGRVVMTAAASMALFRSGDLPKDFLDRHQSGDWGEVADVEEWYDTDDAAKSGAEVLSMYTTSAGDSIWVVTTGDRSQTTILLSQEY